MAQDAILTPQDPGAETLPFMEERIAIMGATVNVRVLALAATEGCAGARLATGLTLNPQIQLAFAEDSSWTVASRTR